MVKRRTYAFGRFALFVGLVGSWAASCVPAPKRDYTPEEVETIDSIEELMRVHAHHMDPLFAVRDDATFSDAQLAAMADAGRTLMATTVTLRDRFGPRYPESFTTQCNDMHIHADELQKAATKKDARGARESIEAIRSLCQTCHREHR
jgi:hypothetical protein